MLFTEIYQPSELHAYILRIARLLNISIGYTSSGLARVQFRMKLVRVGNSLRVTIPKEIVEAFELEEGDTLMISSSNSEIIIKKAEPRT